MAELRLEDIAKRVGVSRSTVSRVVNASPNVRPEVRERVLKEIQETGYHPNAAARSLVSQRTGIIGLVLPRSVSSFFTDPFFPHLTRGIALGCNNHNLTLSLFLVDSKDDEEKITPRISRRGMLDGILIQSGQPDDPLIDFLTRSSIPSAIIGRPFHTDGVSFIDIDNVAAAACATRHLLSLDYQRVAMITGTHGTTVAADRLAGYRQALNEAGLAEDPALIAEGDFSESSGYSAMKRLLHARPDAIFAASDIMAVGAMHAAQEQGLRVPQDVAFIGFDDIPISGAANISLSTIRQPIMKLGIRAVELLIDLIENGVKPARCVRLDTELVIRDSCGARLRRKAAVN